jgi:hypothetical protein
LIVSVVARLQQHEVRGVRRLRDACNAGAAVNGAGRTPSWDQHAAQTKRSEPRASSIHVYATLDPVAPIWHIDATGIENPNATQAEASPESLFSNASSSTPRSRCRPVF